MRSLVGIIRLNCSVEKLLGVARFWATEKRLLANPYQSKGTALVGSAFLVSIAFFDFGLTDKTPALDLFVANEANFSFTVGNFVVFLIGTPYSNRLCKIEMI